MDDIIWCKLRNVFSKSLQKFYTRKGNRLIFTNGMTLNQLALAMWERLGFREIDASVVSRVLKGERLFTKSQLCHFAQILNLSPLEFEHLCDDLMDAILQKFGFDYSFYSEGRGQHTLLKLQEHLFIIKKIKVNDVRFTKEWIEHNLDTLESLSFKNNTQEKNRQVLLGQYLSEYFLCLQTTLTLSDNWKEMFQAINRLENVAYQLKNRSLLNISQYERGNTHYILGNYSQALKSLRQVQTEVDEFDYGESSTLRATALCLAFQNQETEFNQVKKRLKYLIRNRPDELKAPLLEALGRAEYVLNNKTEGERFLESSLQACERLYAQRSAYADLRTLQLLSTQLYLASSQLTRIPNPEKLACQAMTIAHTHRLPRLEETINSYSRNLAHATPTLITSKPNGW